MKGKAIFNADAIRPSPHDKLQALYNLICEYALRKGITYKEAEKLIITAIGEDFGNG